MTPEKILSVIANYKEKLQAEGAAPQRLSPKKSFGASSQNELANHAYYLTETVAEHIRNHKIEKAHRHLGSLQTILSFLRWYSLEELMSHNRPAS